MESNTTPQEMDSPILTPTTAGALLSDAQKANLQSVATHLLTIYRTLASMHYLPSDAIIPGPHTLSDDLLSTYHSLSLSPSIIYLYHLLPYIDSTRTSSRDFFQESTFFNPLCAADVKRGRDPRYTCPTAGDFEDENGEYMRPWYTPLSCCSNHSSLMIYDAEGHRIWAVEQIDGCTTDPKFVAWYGGKKDGEGDEEASNWGESDDSGWEDEDEEGDVVMSDEVGSEGSSEFWSEEEEGMETEVEAMVKDQDEDVDFDEGFEHVEELSEQERWEADGVDSKNENDLEKIRSRPADEFLGDVNRWYLELKELPGGGEHNHDWEPEYMRPMFVRNGWPDRFDGDAFEIDFIRTHCENRARYFAEEPLRQVECHEGWIDYSARQVEQSKKEVSEAKTREDEWKARFQLWQAEENEKRNFRDIKEKKEQAERLCPGGVCQKEEDLPLWQLEQIREEMEGKRSRLEYDSTMPEQYKDDPQQQIVWKHNRRRAEEELARYEAAFQASKADAEHLCPGRTFQEATGRRRLGGQDTLDKMEMNEGLLTFYSNELQSVRKFAETVPQDVPQTREMVEKHVQEMEDGVKKTTLSLEGHRKHLAEHGNTYP